MKAKKLAVSITVAAAMSAFGPAFGQSTSGSATIDAKPSVGADAKSPTGAGVDAKSSTDLGVDANSSVGSSSSGAASDSASAGSSTSTDTQGSASAGASSKPDEKDQSSAEKGKEGIDTAREKQSQ